MSLSTERVAGIDLLRIVAVVGIVWFHTEGAPLRLIGYAGLPVFLLIFFALIAKQSQTHNTRYFLKRRWDRLLKPWLFWSAVYGAGRIVKAAYTNDLGSLDHLLSLETFLVGTSIHLWYLPYAFLSGLLVYMLNRRLWRIDHGLVALVATLIGVLTLTVCTLGTPLRQFAAPLPQWEFGMAAIPLGLAVGRSLVAPWRIQVRLLWIISGTTLATCAVLGLLHPGSPPIPYGLAIALVCLVCGGQINGNGILAALVPLTYGIYLVHPLVMYGLKQFFPADGHCVVSIALTTCFSGAFTWGLMKTPLRRVV